MKITYDPKAYSRGRTTVMGIATAMIVWFHCEIKMPMGTMLEFTKGICDLGVDMFLLASGVGMYFALEKHASFHSFIGSRLRRIIPVFLLATIPWFAYRDLMQGGRNISAFLMNISTLSFWLEGNLTCWYVSSIVVLYFLTPFYVKLWKIHPSLNGAIICLIYTVVTTVLLGWIPDCFGHIMIIFARLPVYLFGLSVGKMIKEGRFLQISVPVAICLSVVSLLLVAAAMGKFSIVVNWSFKYIAYGPLAVMLSFFFAQIPACKITDYLGKYSLEVYLLFEKFQAVLADQRWMWPLMEKSDVPRPMIALALALFGAVILQWLGKKITECLFACKSLDNSLSAG